MNNGGENLPEGLGVTGWGGSKDGKQENCNSVIIKIQFLKNKKNMGVHYTILSISEYVWNLL